MEKIDEIEIDINIYGIGDEHGFTIDSNNENIVDKNHYRISSKVDMFKYIHQETTQIVAHMLGLEIDVHDLRVEIKDAKEDVKE